MDSTYMLRGKGWTVSELIDNDIGVWKIDTIKSIFYDIDQHAILQVPLPNLHRSMIIDEVQTSTHREASHRFFNSLWGIKLPKNIIHFIWRAIHNILLTVDILSKRKADVPLECKFYDVHTENNMHLFNSCVYSR
ncbi:hypothetical protein LIER_37905 [Lithospermum erythrorhizon]|uniref:Reverse transcriptase zinc-binding domain-containing protein n=1 Tax=Lithospermum erythrorhizon TaxID=34254 RepID=A0AAV3PS20_LITER